MHGKWTHENFELHHAEHPEIYEMFCRFALQVVNLRDHYSAKSIFHRIRWETMVGEQYPASFKIDDGWISHYARMFMEDYPQYEGFFQTRLRQNSYHLD